ncbi:hypothetical protein [Paraburkholderia piptadeniae]|uniref:hypothetical protein n=1 Tax=Paraburkholderia piptadeniae TaxID=1701573 RepID=UPI000B3F9A83|nr:hypothetical protein [Paraburkholderia piptadeniae]
MTLPLNHGILRHVPDAAPMCGGVPLTQLDAVDEHAFGQDSVQDQIRDKPQCVHAGSDRDVHTSRGPN